MLGVSQHGQQLLCQLCVECHKAGARGVRALMPLMPLLRTTPASLVLVMLWLVLEASWCGMGWCAWLAAQALATKQ